jgi:serine/threonine-protein kinase CTR1
MENGSLYNVLHDTGIFIDANLALQFAIDASLGLNYLHLHDPPIIHRDFKSLNCLIDQGMSLKVSQGARKATHTHTYIYVCVCMCVFEFVCVCVCVCVSFHINIFICKDIG